MIHLALVITAVVFVGWFVLLMFSLVFRGMDRTPGCGCLSIVAVAAIVATILAFRF
jgi:hypothetical protein